MLINTLGLRAYSSLAAVYFRPTKSVIQEIAKFISTDKCLEVGSGNGLWAYLLSLENINIIATDNKSESQISASSLRFKKESNKDMCLNFGIDEQIFDYKKKEFLPIKKSDAFDAVEEYQDCNVLFLCWSRVDPIDKFRGNKIIFIGENDGGCTSCPPKNEWNLVKKLEIPQWPGINDFVGLYVKKNA